MKNKESPKLHKLERAELFNTSHQPAAKSVSPCLSQTISHSFEVMNLYVNLRHLSFDNVSECTLEFNKSA